MISVRISIRVRDRGAGQTDRWISTPGRSTMYVTGGPTDEFQCQQIYQSCDGQNHCRILMPVWWTMLVTDKPIDEFWRPFNLSCLWRTDQPTNFNACSIFDDCDGHTNQWILATVWSTISVTDRPTEEFRRLVCLFVTDRPTDEYRRLVDLPSPTHYRLG